MTLWEAIEAENAAFDAIQRRISEGVLSSVAVLRLVGEYRETVRRSAMIEARDRVQELIP